MRVTCLPSDDRVQIPKGTTPSIHQSDASGHGRPRRHVATAARCQRSRGARARRCGGAGPVAAGPGRSSVAGSRPLWPGRTAAWTLSDIGPPWLSPSILPTGGATASCGRTSWPGSRPTPSDGEIARQEIRSPAGPANVPVKLQSLAASHFTGPRLAHGGHSRTGPSRIRYASTLDADRQRSTLGPLHQKILAPGRISLTMDRPTMGSMYV